MPLSDAACAIGWSPGTVEQAEALESDPAEVDGREDRALGVEVAKPGAGAVAGECRVPCCSTDLVGPLPSDLHGMIGAVAARSTSAGGEISGAVKEPSDDTTRGDVAQRGAELLGEALELARRDLQPLAARAQSAAAGAPPV